MASIEQLKEKFQKAKDELTKAEAVMGEVKANIDKEVESLKGLGVKIPEREDYLEIEEWYDAVQKATRDFLEKIEADIAEQQKEIEGIIEKWEEE
jgi:phage-related tail protein